MTVILAHRKMRLLRKEDRKIKPGPGDRHLPPKWHMWAETLISRGMEGTVIMEVLRKHGFDFSKNPQLAVEFATNKPAKEKFPHRSDELVYDSFEAAKVGDIDSIRIYLAAGQDPNSTKREAGINWTIIMQGVRCNQIEVCRFMIENGADLFLADRFGRTAIHLASISNFLQIAQLLGESGCPMSAYDCYGNTALHLSVDKGNIKVVHWMLEFVKEETRKILTSDKFRNRAKKLFAKILEEKLSSYEMQVFERKWFLDTIIRLCKEAPQEQRVILISPQSHIVNRIVNLFDEGNPEDPQDRYFSETQFMSLMTRCLWDSFANHKNLMGKTALHVACSPTNSKNLELHQYHLIKCLINTHAAFVDEKCRAGKTPEGYLIDLVRSQYTDGELPWEVMMEPPPESYDDPWYSLRRSSFSVQVVAGWDVCLHPASGHTFYVKQEIGPLEISKAEATKAEIQALKRKNKEAMGIGGGNIEDDSEESTVGTIDDEPQGALRWKKPDAVLLEEGLAGGKQQRWEYRIRNARQLRTIGLWKEMQFKGEPPFYHNVFTNEKTYEIPEDVQIQDDSVKESEEEKRLELLQSLKDAFNKIDVDQSGYLDTNELAGVLGILGDRLEESEVVTILNKADSSGDGTIDFDEFVALIDEMEREATDRGLAILSKAANAPKDKKNSDDNTEDEETANQDGPVKFTVYRNGDWEEIWDGYNARFFFYNKKWEQSQWERPLAMTNEKVEKSILPITPITDPPFLRGAFSNAVSILRSGSARQLNGLVICPWGCGTWLARGKKQLEHERENCMKRVLGCNFGCSLKLRAEQWVKQRKIHEEVCIKRKVQCPLDCGEMVVFDTLEKHKRETCKKRPMPPLTCTYQCGKQWVGPSEMLAELKADKELHELEMCPQRIVTCTWKGCMMQYKACDSRKHRATHIRETGVSTYAGAGEHIYKVHPSSRELKVQLWGAGGGSGHLKRLFSGSGGGGAFVECIIDVYPGEKLVVVVGNGGKAGVYGLNRNTDTSKDGVQTGVGKGGAPGGGDGRATNEHWACGGGGGFSCIQRQGPFGRELLVAAGGGGGGAYKDGGSGDCPGRNDPVTGFSADRTLGENGQGGVGGGDPNAKIYDGVTSGGAGETGTEIQGGNGNIEFGGGGGGGRWGGGGGGWVAGIVGGGGGGSSFVFKGRKKLFKTSGGRRVAGIDTKEHTPPMATGTCDWDVLETLAGEGGKASTTELNDGMSGAVRIIRRVTQRGSWWIT